MKKIYKIILPVFSLILLFIISVSNLRVGLFSVGDTNKIDLASLFFKALANTENDIWYVDPNTGKLYYSNGDSGCTDASSSNGYGPSEPQMCHIITGGSVTTTNSGTLDFSTTATGEMSVTGPSGSISASMGGSISVQQGATYNWVPGTLYTCPSGSFPSCDWQECS